MSDVTVDPIIQAAAVAVERELMSGEDYSLALDSDEALAKAVVAAVRPLIEAQAYENAARAFREPENRLMFNKYYVERLERWAANTREGAKPDA